MWQRFTERARRSVFFAQEEAGRMGESYVSTEHLLLGMLRESDHVAARVIERLGVALSDVRAAVERQVTRGEGNIGTDMQLTPRAKRVIDLAYDEAKLLNNNYIGTEHLLLGMTREGEGLAGRVLDTLGVTLERARAELRLLQAEGKASNKENNKEGGKEGNPEEKEDTYTTGETSESRLSSFKDTVARLAVETFRNRRQPGETPPTVDAGTQGSTDTGPKRGYIGILREEERAVIEFVPAETDIAAFEDVMRIKDEYAYRELVRAGKILLLEAGTQAKFLKRGSGKTDYVRILTGKLAGEPGYVLRPTLQDLKPDDRPFPPEIQE